jgi:glycine dehydrogenase subunit 2
MTGAESAAASHRTAAPGGMARAAPLLGGDPEPTLYAISASGRRAWQLPTTGLEADDAEGDDPLAEIPASLRRERPPRLPEVSERDLVAHITRLAHRQYAVDLGFYPLGSCTMKYNPKGFDELVHIGGLAGVHPRTPASGAQGWLRLLVELEEALCEITGMHAASLQPAAGAAGELTGLLMIRARHEALGQRRSTVVIPDSAHGTNPASVALAGFEVATVPTDSRGCVDLDAFARALSDRTAAVMLTNPNTLGIFERDILELARLAHEAGALLYYDGANLNAILGVARPGDMGFDVVHVNLHKTFATPHGGGGPGAGPVAVTAELAPFLPGPKPARLAGSRGEPVYGLVVPEHSIGRVHAHYGNALVLARALGYVLVHGAEGLRRVAELAVLNANWLRRRIEGVLEAAYPEPCMHEFVCSLAELRRRNGVRVHDVAKALIEEGFHAPTVAFPLIVDEALMIEPTETESPETLEAFAAALERALARAEREGKDGLRALPSATPVRRPDEAKAARQLVATDPLASEPAEGS